MIQLRTGLRCCSTITTVGLVIFFVTGAVTVHWEVMRHGTTSPQFSRDWGGLAGGRSDLVGRQSSVILSLEVNSAFVG